MVRGRERGGGGRRERRGVRTWEQEGLSFKSIETRMKTRARARARARARVREVEK